MVQWIITTTAGANVSTNTALHSSSAAADLLTALKDSNGRI